MSAVSNVPFLTGVRRIFYAVSPNETSFATLEETPAYLKEATPFFLGFVLLEIVVTAVTRGNNVRLSDGVTSLSNGIFSQIPAVVMGSIHLLSYAWVYENWRLTELPWDSAWTWWLAFLAVDCSYYWFHRVAHEVNFMWAFHQVHHSSEDYNFTTALRQSVLQGHTSWARQGIMNSLKGARRFRAFYIDMLFYLPMALFIPPSMFITHFELNLLYQFWIHTQYVKSLGPLEYILNTPSHHRVHHGRNPYCIDKNYAGVLIIWDRMFGTFAKEEEEVAYGLTHPVNTFETFSLQFGYIQYMFRRFWDVRGFRNKISVLLCGPGWSPGKPRTGLITDIPQVKKPVKKYQPEVNGWTALYILLHFSLVLVAYQELVARKMGLTQTTVLALLVYLGYCLSCFGRLLDQSVTAVYHEIVRCTLFLLGDIIMCQQGFYGNPGDRPWPVIALHGIFAFSLAVWVVHVLKAKVKVEVKQKRL